MNAKLVQELGNDALVAIANALSNEIDRCDSECSNAPMANEAFNVICRELEQRGVVVSDCVRCPMA